MTGSDIIKLAREKHIVEREKDPNNINAMRFIIQFQNGKTYIYKYVANGLNAIKRINLEDVIMAQVVSGFSPMENRNLFTPIIYNLIYIQERYEVPQEVE